MPHSSQWVGIGGKLSIPTTGAITGFTIISGGTGYTAVNHGRHHICGAHRAPALMFRANRHHRFHDLNEGRIRQSSHHAWDGRYRRAVIGGR